MSGEREERLGAALAWGAASLRAAGWAPLSVFVLHLVVSRGFGAYVAWPGLDVPMHFVGGVAMAHFVFCALGGPAVGPVIGSLTRLGRGLGTFVSVGAAAAIWEFAEWTSDRMGISAAQVGLGDTLLDMLLGMTGAACYLGATWRLGRGAAGRRAQRAESAGVEHAP